MQIGGNTLHGETFMCLHPNSEGSKCTARGVTPVTDHRTGHQPAPSNSGNSHLPLNSHLFLQAEVTWWCPASLAAMNGNAPLMNMNPKRTPPTCPGLRGPTPDGNIPLPDHFRWMWHRRRNRALLKCAVAPSAINASFNGRTLLL